MGGMVFVATTKLITFQNFEPSTHFMIQLYKSAVLAFADVLFCPFGDTVTEPL